MKASCLGWKASHILSAPGCSGEVLAATSGAVYLTTFDGDLVWVAGASAPMHCRAVHTPIMPEDLRQGMPFSVDSRRLLIGHSMLIDLTIAPVWTPNPVRAERPQSPVDVVKSLLDLLGSPDAKGLARVLSGLIRPGQDEPAAALPHDDLVLKRAAKFLAEIIEGCRAGDLPRILQVGLGLIGLGPGLTPSGDDFMGGLLFTHTLLSASTTQDMRRARLAVEGFLAQARPLTHMISYTLLDDLAHGHGVEPLHDLVGELRSPSGADQMAVAASRLTQLGHSTGWDMLAGATLGALLVEQPVRKST